MIVTHMLTYVYRMIMVTVTTIELEASCWKTSSFFFIRYIIVIMEVIQLVWVVLNWSINRKIFPCAPSSQLLRLLFLDKIKNVLEMSKVK